MPRFAAVDIGSNSVRLEVAEPGQGVIASDRETVRLGESVYRTGRLSEPALRSVCGVLTRMGAICRDARVDRMRAVATAAVRDAANQAEFLARGSAALGAPVEIISGAEEARIICRGVVARWSPLPGRSLIVDVGGGSTELIVTRSGEAEQAWSLPLGALRDISVAEIDEILRPPMTQLAPPPDLIIGTSATAAAVISAVREIPRDRREDADRLSATLPEVRELFARISTMDLAARAAIPAFGAQRAEIIVPGARILLRVLEMAGARGITYSGAGVREGIIAELAASF